MKREHIVLGTTILALGIFSLVPIIRATEPPEVEANGSAIDEPFASNAGVSLRLPLQGSEDLTYGAVTESPTGEPSASELNRQLSNPVSSLWSISNQFNNFELNNGQWNNNWNFQPVLPVGLTKDWNLITRPVMPFYNIVPHETSPGSTCQCIPGYPDRSGTCRSRSLLSFRSSSKASCFSDADKDDRAGACCSCPRRCYWVKVITSSAQRHGAVFVRF